MNSGDLMQGHVFSPAVTSNAGSSGPKPEATPTLASGRPLPPLLFVTSEKRLSQNIGQAAASQAIQTITAAGQSYYDVSNDQDVLSAVRRQVRAEHEGVVIVGGYDVVPAVRLDVLDPAARSLLSWRVMMDGDHFVVWSDTPYVDRDGDGLPELPISRIADGRSPELVLTALAASAAPASTSRFGIRNRERDFVSAVYDTLPGAAALFASAPTGVIDISPNAVDVAADYIVLHGDYKDGSKFFGEAEGGNLLEAFNIASVPPSVNGVIFSSCCWGALTVQTLAEAYTTGQDLGVKPFDTSIALTYLRRGGRAFIGCTGSHYSPTEPPFQYFGQPLHMLFWSYYLVGEPPAKALHRARLDYAAGIPHGRTTPLEIAIEKKTLAEFACLGLGW